MGFIKPRVCCEHGVRFDSTYQCTLCKDKIHKRTIDILNFFTEQNKKDPECNCPGFCVIHTKFKIEVK